MALFGLFGKKKGDGRAGYGGMSAKEIMKIGRIPMEVNALTRAGQRWPNAQAYFGFFLKGSRVCSVIIVVSLLIMVGSVLLRPHPLLLVSYPDGSVRCAGENLDLAHHRINPRQAKQQALCDTLDQRFSTPLVTEGTITRATIKAAAVPSSASAPQSPAPSSVSPPPAPVQ